MTELLRLVRAARRGIRTDAMGPRRGAKVPTCQHQSSDAPPDFYGFVDNID